MGSSAPPRLRPHRPAGHREHPAASCGRPRRPAIGNEHYSILGADHGYQLLWVLAVATVVLILFHDLGSRLGVVTGRGPMALLRERHGAPWAHAATVPLVVANLGTACAEFAGVAAATPWGLAFIGSYAADKRPDVSELRYERIDVFTGAIMTGVIGAFVVIACAATLQVSGRSIDDARDAATALEPLAGSLAATLFGVGLLGAALLAASVVPLSTAYSVSEAAGRAGRLDAPWRQAPVFYGTYVAVTIVAAGLVLIPGAPLIDILYLTQALNAIVLVPLLWAIRTLARDRRLMGEHALGGTGDVAALVAFVALTVCVIALGWLTAR